MFYYLFVLDEHKLRSKSLMRIWLSVALVLVSQVIVSL